MPTVKCVGALLVRNEADRYLKRALQNARLFCDEIVVIDDGSTDATAQLCRDAGCIVHEQGGDGWWGGAKGGVGRESSARQTLWTVASERGDWVYVFDADHELLGLRPTDFRHLLAATNVNSWACVLWDCWDSDAQHRVDGYWQAWRTPRPWLAKARPTSNFVPEWNSRAIHAGHFPVNYPFVMGVMPEGTGIRHLGYVEERYRLAKRAKYLNLQSA